VAVRDLNVAFGSLCKALHSVDYVSNDIVDTRLRLICSSARSIFESSRLCWGTPSLIRTPSIPASPPKLSRKSPVLTQTDQPTTLAVPSNSAESTKHTRSTDQAEPRKQAKSTKQPKLKNRGKPTKLAKIRKQRKPPLDARGTWPLDKVKKPVPEFLYPS
jgi:hypothetical protein